MARHSLGRRLARLEQGQAPQGPRIISITVRLAGGDTETVTRHETIQLGGRSIDYREYIAPLCPEGAADPATEHLASI